MDAPTTPARKEAAQAWRPVLMAVLASALPFAFLAGRFDWVCDDAYISFRYAKNLAAGFGLRYNPGEDPPVEGYTNFLWVLAMAVVEWLRADPAIWSRVLSLSSAMGLLCLLGRFVQRAVDGSLAVLVTTLLVFVALPPVQVWSTSGLATLPMALCVFGVYDALLRDPARPSAGRAAAFACLAALLRADAFLFLAMVFGLAGGTFAVRRDKALGRALVIAGGALALCIGAHFACRTSYYGDWLPNTARMKAFAVDDELRAARFDRGVGYVVSFFLSMTSAFVVPLVSLLLLRATSAKRVVVHSVLILLGTVLYAIRAGGDFMTFGRFFVPAMPFLALLFASSARTLIQRTSAAVGLGYGVLIAALSLLPAWDVQLFPRSIFDRFHFRWNDTVEKRQSELVRWTDMNKNSEQWVVYGKMLGAIREDGDSLVRGGIGAIGYYSGMHIYDTHGLTNTHWRKVNPPAKRKSPGHDREMEAADFVEFAPTYLGAFFMVDDGTGPYDLFGGREAWPQHGWYEFYGKLADPEVHELPDQPEFPSGKSLLIFRFKKNQQ